MLLSRLFAFLLESLDKIEVNDFVREGLQMRLFDHAHVMKIHGICMSKNCDGGGGDGVCHSPLLVLPFMENGDLKNYLRQRRSKLPSNEDENTVDDAELFRSRISCIALSFIRFLVSLLSKKSSSAHRLQAEWTTSRPKGSSIEI